VCAESARNPRLRSFLVRADIFDWHSLDTTGAMVVVAHATHILVASRFASRILRMHYAIRAALYWGAALTATSLMMPSTLHRPVTIAKHGQESISMLKIAL